MIINEEQIESLAPKPAAFSAGKKLSAASSWQVASKSDRALWGEIKGSGSKPYYTQIDTTDIAFKCSCPSRQFPCKHAIALLLLYNKDQDNLKLNDEPDWVSSWLDKRKVRQTKKEEPKEQSEESKERSQQNKEKTQERRLEGVLAGVSELELWLKDLIRIGILELPNRPQQYFERVAARMVDAKASGLAGWVRSLGNLDYHGDSWEDDAIKIISKVYLLLQTLKNYDQLDPLWQVTIKNLAGWSQSSKELLAGTEIHTQKDQWLVIGQLTEEGNDITVQRSFLIGCESNKTALVLNFATKFSTFESLIVPGVVIEAELAFFPSIQPHRAVVKLQNHSYDHVINYPKFHDNWNSVDSMKIERMKKNPWANDHLFLLKDARLYNYKEQWLMIDDENVSAPVWSHIDDEKCLKWLTITGNETCNVAGIIRNDQIIPLGIFFSNTYKLL